MRSVPFALVACATTPYSGMPTTSSTVQVGGFASVSGAEIGVFAYDFDAGTYVRVASTRARWKPWIEASALGASSPPLYLFETSAVLDQPQYWDDSGGENRAMLRVSQYTPSTGAEQAILFTDRDGGPACIDAHLTAGSSLYDVACLECGYQHAEAVLIDTTGALPGP